MPPVQEKYKFNGKELDTETGYYYYGARYYNPRISQFYATDPLAEKYPGFSPYTYTADNPVMLVDPDGREPIKPLVGTVNLFINLLNNSPHKVGLYKGNEASNYLKKLGKTEFNWKQLRPLLTQTGYFNQKKGRYIYTKKGGWIDMVHFLFYAGKAYQYKLEGKKNPIGEAVQDGYIQEFSDKFSAPYSSYSYEDLASDKFGADFAVNYFDPESNKSFGEQLSDYLNNVLEATDPEDAPNFNELPKKYSNDSPSRTNTTTIPVYTEENP